MYRSALVSTHLIENRHNRLMAGSVRYHSTASSQSINNPINSNHSSVSVVFYLYFVSVIVALDDWCVSAWSIDASRYWREGSLSPIILIMNEAGNRWRWRHMQLDAFRVTHKRVHVTQYARDCEPVAASPLDRQDVDELKSASWMTVKPERLFFFLESSSVPDYIPVPLFPSRCVQSDGLFCTHIQIHTESSIGRAAETEADALLLIEPLASACRQLKQLAVACGVSLRASVCVYVCTRQVWCCVCVRMWLFAVDKKDPHRILNRKPLPSPQ